MWKWSKKEFDDYYEALKHAESLEKRGYFTAVVNMHDEIWRVRYMRGGTI